jgi:polysaccharide pyruvyl transferase WcaK-like protein
MALCEAMGFSRRAAVVPDMAFSIDVPDEGHSLADDRPKIGLSPMVYLDPQTWPEKDPTRYRQYLDKLIRIAESCISRGLDVYLFASDGPDNRAIDQIIEEVASRSSGVTQGLLTKIDTGTVDRFVGVASELDIVIATRLHGVILSLAAGSAVVALSYDRKVAAVMEEVGQSEACLDADRFSADEVTALIEAMLKDSPIPDIEPKIRACRKRVLEQFDYVFGEGNAGIEP